MPRVSVIMPAYNGAATIAESIESVLAQTYTDWELIICDDCSTDNTYEIASVYTKRHPNIKLLRNEKNLGPGAARNHCIRHACGEYLAIMDCDDLSDPKRFEKQVVFLDAHPEYALVSVWAVMFDKDGVWRTLRYPLTPSKNKVAFISQFLYGGTLLKRSVVDEVGGYREGRDYAVGEDHDLFVRIYAAGHVGYNIPEVLLHYRFDRNCNYKITFKKRIMMWKNSRNCVRMLGLPFWYRIRPYKHLFSAFIPRPILKLLRGIHIRIIDRNFVNTEGNVTKG